MEEDMHELLHRISNLLSSEELAHMIFLCGPDITFSDKETIKNTLQLFKFLEHKGLISESDLSYLKELFNLILRRDILKVLKTTKYDMDTYLRNNSPQISAYRSLLYHISQQTTQENVESAKFLLEKRNPRVAKAVSMLEIIVEMEKAGDLSEDNMKCLKTVFINGKRKDIVQKIEEFEKKCRDFSKNEIEAQIEKMSLEESEMKHTTKTSTSQQDTSQTDIGVYELKRNPHGKCLIINNHNFKAARSLKLKMEDRFGSDKDTEAIKSVFHSRNYTTEEHDNLTGKEILSVIERYAKENHNEKDSFVCFILSHGDAGIIYGTDGEPVLLNTILSHFDGKHCRSMIGKPKMFFIQACQGSDIQRPVYTDDTDSSSTEYAYDHGAESLPDHSDFLTVFATVENYACLRNARNGSIYIQDLCTALKDPKFYDIDLITILTHLNDIVSGKEFKVLNENVKQMPSFKSELRKRLILPAPAQTTEPLEQAQGEL
ncbi:caspase-8 [Pelobates cultripes]|uniref:Caspase-8 n=2 Tax=Pelobates cultripes TaxID=61616 RepID=A0AAD1SMJ1_PELCU|nr:caspase-8 [Pelobates cultripes]